MSIVSSTQSTKQSNVIPVNPAASAAQTLQLLLGLEAQLALPDALNEEERRYGQGVARRYPPALLQALAAMSERHGGSLAGFPVDPELLRSPSAYAAAMDPIATCCERIARCIRDEGVRRHRDAGVKAGIAVMAMRREGTLGELPLESDLRVVRTVAPRRRKAKAVQQPPVVTPVTPTK